MVDKHILNSKDPLLFFTEMISKTAFLKVINTIVESLMRQPQTVVNNRFTSIYTLESRPKQLDFEINPSNVHRHIFEAIKKLHESAIIFSVDQVYIDHSKYFPPKEDYFKTFTDCRTCSITKRVYISFKLK